jgi:hypothetical protein
MFENLIEFQGINLKEGFDSRRAKVLLKDLMDKIAPRAAVLYPRLSERRKGVTLDRGGVWDFFGKKKFTEEVHFTTSLNMDGVSIALTVPNAARTRWRQLRNLCSNPESRTKLERVIHEVRTVVPQLWVRLEQRHFLGRRRSVQDARLDFNVDTWAARKKSDTKNIPMWFDALVEGIENKTSANFQLQFSARFSYTHPKIDKPEFAETAVQALKAFKPLYSIITNGKRT